MKKGLLSILALAVTIVGCQNYDDQFDALNTQISALKSQVEGLAGVQSQITSLAGTLSALQSTVANLPSSSDVSSAIASELTDIISQVEALQAALDLVATADDLSNVSDAVTDAQNALNDLLNSSNVYSEDLVVNSQGTLDFAVALGEKLAIVNGSVYINVTAQMNLTDVQTVVNNIGTVVEDFSYIAASTVSAVTFNNIIGVAGNLEASQAGPYAFEGLVAAGNIHLATGTKMTAVHFDALTTVTSINVSTLTDHGAGHGNGTVAARVNPTIVTQNAISGTKLAAVRLGALPYYTPGSLSITTDGEESTIDISSLASVDADGDETALNLTIDGATSLDFSKITEGNISATNVTNLTGGTTHDGSVTFSKVANVVLPNLTGALAYDVDDSTLLTFHAIGGKTTATGATYPTLNLDGFNKLTSVIIEGTFTGVTLNDNSRLTDITYTATTGALAITANNDVEALAIAGKASSITISNNTNVLTADIDTELGSYLTTGAPTAGSLTVHNNSDLEALHSAYDPVDTIQIHHNGSLAMVDFEGTASAGATTDAVDVNIGGNGQGNGLVALSVVDSYDAATATTDTGVMSDEAGLSSLSAWITAATANTAYDIQIYLDEIEEFTPAGATATATVDTIDNIDWADAANNGELLVVSLTPGTAAVTTPGTAAVAGKAAWYLDDPDADSITLLHTNPVNLVETTLMAIDATDLNSNPQLAVDAILADADIIAAADVVGVTVGAYVGGEASLSVQLGATLVTATTEGSYDSATASNSTVAVDDVIGIRINGQTVTGTVGADAAAAVAGAATANALATRVAALWTAAQATTVSNSMFNVTANGTGKITVTGIERFGSATSGKSVSMVVGTGASTTTIPLVAYKIGYTTDATDNTTGSTGVIITVTSDDAGEDEGALQSGAVALTAGTAAALTTSATLDVATAADATADSTVPAVAGATTNRLTWISGS